MRVPHVREMITPVHTCFYVRPGPVRRKTVRELEEKGFDHAVVVLQDLSHLSAQDAYEDGDLLALIIDEDALLGFVPTERLRDLSQTRRPLRGSDPSIIRPVWEEHLSFSELLHTLSDHQAALILDTGWEAVPRGETERRVDWNNDNRRSQLHRQSDVPVSSVR